MQYRSLVNENISEHQPSPRNNMSRQSGHRQGKDEFVVIDEIRRDVGGVKRVNRSKDF